MRNRRWLTAAESDAILAGQVKEAYAPPRGRANDPHHSIGIDQLRYEGERFRQAKILKGPPALTEARRNSLTPLHMLDFSQTVTTPNKAVKFLEGDSRRIIFRIGNMTGGMITFSYNNTLGQLPIANNTMYQELGFMAIDEIWITTSVASKFVTCFAGYPAYEAMGDNW